MEPKTSILSHNIKFLRKTKGFSQEHLAEKLKIKRSNIAAYETKQVEPRLRIILEISKLFEIDIKHLLSERLTENKDYPAFIDVDNTSLETKLPLSRLDKNQINDFVEKTINIKKVLNGFKAFYTFKKSRLKENSPLNDKLAFDIDSFIQLMEHLLQHNEFVIQAIKSNETAAVE